MAWFVEMKRVTEKNKCTGCGACANACAGGFIFMRSDISGFLYPTIDTGRCVGCGKCRQICPQNAESAAVKAEASAGKAAYKTAETADKTREAADKNREAPDKAGKTTDGNIYLGVHASDKSVRMESSSGGAFSVFAEEILSRGGAVCAAALCEDMTVRHIIVEKPEDLPKLRKTKYVQSETGMIFRDIRDILKESPDGISERTPVGTADRTPAGTTGRMPAEISDTASGKTCREVLFVGTPCQCMGLKSFLGREYKNLYTASLVCYGVPSPKVFSNYIKYLGKQKGGRVTAFYFRDKRNHDNGHTVAYTVAKASGNACTNAPETEYSHSLYADAYSKLYFRNRIIRPSCFGCAYAGPDRETDITLGDFWGIENVKKEFDDGDGTSLVILHSEKSRGLWECVKAKTEYFECGREDVLQPRLKGPTENPQPYPAMGLLVKGAVFRKHQK